MVFHQVFRLRDLPSEIRNQIYQEILCSFEAPPPELEGLDRQLATKGLPDAPTGITPAVHSIDTSILRTSKQVHHEAYDVMVKTNHFVRVQTEKIPMADLLLSSRLPIVTMDRAHSAQFNGYALSIKISGSRVYRIDDDEGYNPVFDFMIIGRDLGRLCRVIGEGDMYLERQGPFFKAGAAVDIHVNPTFQTCPPYRAPIDEYFSGKIQSTLLQPFRKYIRGIRASRVEGTVSTELADAVVADITAQRWPEPKKAIEEFTARKEKGNVYFRERKLDMARKIWSDLIWDLDMIHEGPSWAYLKREGGETILNQIPELYFLTNLNILHLYTIELSEQQDRRRVNNEKWTASRAKEEAKKDDNEKKLWHHAKFAFNQAQNAMMAAPYEGATWRPTSAQVAKLFYRRALSLRLVFQPVPKARLDHNMLALAVKAITMAWQLAPREDTIRAEKDVIMAWQREVNGEVPLLRM